MLEEKYLLVAFNTKKCMRVCACVRTCVRNSIKILNPKFSTLINVLINI